MQEIVNVDELLVPIFYTNYGRARGNSDSAGYFAHIIQQLIIGNPTKILKKHLGGDSKKYLVMENLNKFRKLNPSIPLINEYEVKLQRFYKNLKELGKLGGSGVSLRVIDFDLNDIFQRHKYMKRLEDKRIYTLPSFCMIQNPSHRGAYDMIKKEDDIVFCKALESDSKDLDYISTMMGSISSGFKFFPKYIDYGLPGGHHNLKLQGLYERINRYKKLYYNENYKMPLRIAYYDRSDVCPNQVTRYKDYIEKLEVLYPDIEFKVTSFGHGNDLESHELALLLNETDIVLYAEPDHIDPYPNTILNAISKLCMVICIGGGDEDKRNGIEEIQEIFGSLVFYSLAEIFDSLTTSLFMKNYKKSCSQIRLVTLYKLAALDLLNYIYIVDRLDKLIGDFLVEYKKSLEN